MLFFVVGVIAIAAPIGAQSVFAQAPTPDNVQIKSIPGESLPSIVKDKFAHSWPWYVTRASGLVAAASLVMLLLSGIGSVTGQTFKYLEPLTAWATHRALGITFSIAILVHMSVLLFDHFAPFNLMEILVPWVSTYEPATIAGINFGSLYVALGILAFYGSLVIMIFSLLWIDKKPKTWKFTHLFSYLVIAMVFVHALMIGTDTGSGIVMWLWIASALLVGIAALLRLRRAGKI